MIKRETACSCIMHGDRKVNNAFMEVPRSHKNSNKLFSMNFDFYWKFFVYIICKLFIIHLWLKTITSVISWSILYKVKIILISLKVAYMLFDNSYYA